MSISITLADYQNPSHQDAIRQLMNHYASDPMGGGEALNEQVLAALPQGLGEFPGACTVLAFDGSNNQPVGLVNCIPGFSTFKCQPLLNIHDVVVHSDYRGQGITPRMFAQVDAIARERNCCKITLEVLEGNHPARASYAKCGFTPYELDPQMGQAQFWQKLL